MKTLAVVFGLLIVSRGEAQGLHLGVGQVDITPPVGAPMAGYYTPRYATGTHDPLHAKAMVLEAGGTKIALVSCDLVSLPRDLTQQAREIIRQKTGLPIDHVMITATHAHTTPVIYTEPSRYNLQGDGKRIAQEYTASLPAKISAAVEAANAATQPARLKAAVGEESTLGFSRRYFMKDGSVGWNPGKLNPNIVRPAAPIDPALPVLYFETPDGHPIAAYVNFGVHQDTTGGLEFSADYSYTLEKELKRDKGENFFVLFGIGAAGNVNHINVSKAGKQAGFEEARRIGDVLTKATLAAITKARPVPVDAIHVSDEVLSVKVPKYSSEELDWAKRAQSTFGTDHAASFLDLVKAARMLELAARHGKPLNVEVQVFTLGSQVAIAGFPGEMFAEFGIQLREDSPYGVTILAELANGTYSYIPNRIAYVEGNYEAVSARLPAGTGELMVQSAQEQLLKLFKASAEPR